MHFIRNNYTFYITIYTTLNTYKIIIIITLILIMT